MPTLTRRQAQAQAEAEVQADAATHAMSAPSSPQLCTQPPSPANSHHATPVETCTQGSAGPIATRSPSSSDHSGDSSSDEDALGPDEWPASPTPRPQQRRELQWSEDKNLALANALLNHQPFKAEYGSVTAAWNMVKDELNAAGYTFKACKTIQKHAEELIKEQRRDDAAAAKKSGANEDVTELTQVMAQVVSLIDDEKLKKTATTAHGRAKAKLEREAGAQLRDAAMCGIMDRNNMLDVATLDDATPRENSGQRKKRRHSLSSSDADKENVGPSKPKTKRQRRHSDAGPSTDDALVAVLEKMNAADEELLRKALAAQEATSKKQDELIDKLGQLIQVTAAGLQRQDTAAEERHREEHRQERREQQEDFLRMLAAFTQFNKQN
ncbi:hypothetical protein AURDEDRAFT_174280 [Auricularia subglabra TFB-10046 SS5]|uniref:Myb-like domain-containing protein n=1 Tax=Auricularia subglabra (strain TFB-10046 / SS5) TaxID=717982 RepID=J0D9V3_AURST|nr:hypothetical protein AURDEDRAFT_174280 [Auricularia subglabra TFB-10046 SS5]